MIKCILFDFDGVIVTSKPFFVDYQEKKDINKNEVISFFQGPFSDCLVGKKDLKEELKPYLLKWQENDDVESIIKKWFKFENKPDKQLINKILELKNCNIKSYLVSNQEKYRTEYIKNNLDIENIFEKSFFSSDIGFKKPDKEYFDFVFMEIQKKLSLKKDEILLIDDSIDNVEKAINYGFRGYLYKGFNKFSQNLNELL